MKKLIKDSNGKTIEKTNGNGCPLAQRAEELFSQGFNCCESIIKASIDILELPLPEEACRIGRFFRKGVAGAGCICGALTGGVMILGFLCAEEKAGHEKAEKLRAAFVDKFGSTCCRVIRKNQTIASRLRNIECREITGYTARLLAEISEMTGNDI